MSTRSQLLFGIALVVIAAVIAEFLPAGGPIWMLLTAILALSVAIIGYRLPMIIRVVATGFTFHLSYQMCLIGRTMEPHLSAYTGGAALMGFVVYGALPTLPLLRGWKDRPRVLVCSLMLPISFLFACLVAAFEEFRFVQQHSHAAQLLGAGMTTFRICSAEPSPVAGTAARFVRMMTVLSAFGS